VAALGDEAPRVAALTLGARGDNDIKTAGLVARKAGMNCWVYELNPDELLPYAWDVVKLSDGMDWVGVCFLPPSHEEFRQHASVLLHGLGGPLMRGHFLDSRLLAARSDEELTRLLYRKTLIFSEEMRRDLTRKEYYARVKDRPFSSVAKEVREARGDQPGNKVSYYDLHNHNRRFAWMGSGIIAGTKLETVCPYYDNDWVDLAQRVPPHRRLGNQFYHKFFERLAPELARIPYSNNGTRPDAPMFLWQLGRYRTGGKARLKKLPGILTGGKLTIRDANSEDFSYWISVNEGWQKLIQDTLLDKNARSREYINTDYVAWLITQHGKRLPPARMVKTKSFNYDWSVQIGSLLTFELFLRLFGE